MNGDLQLLFPIIQSKLSKESVFPEKISKYSQSRVLG